MSALTKKRPTKTKSKVEPTVEVVFNWGRGKKPDAFRLTAPDAVSIAKRVTTMVAAKRVSKTAARKATALVVEQDEQVASADGIDWRDVLKTTIENGGEGAAALRGARSREGLTQKELAERVGIAQGHLSEMESGKRSIGKITAKKLGKALRVDYRIFL